MWEFFWYCSSWNGLVLIGLRFIFFGVLVFSMLLVYFFERMEVKFMVRLVRNGVFGWVRMNWMVLLFIFFILLIRFGKFIFLKYL